MPKTATKSPKDFTSTEILEAIREAACRHPVVFVEQVWKILGVETWEHRPSSIGPVLLMAQRRGIIERTHEVVYTTATRTRSGRFLWKSKLYWGGL